jgi:hypothetical protein
MDSSGAEGELTVVAVVAELERRGARSVAPLPDLAVEVAPGGSVLDSPDGEYRRSP